jgi:RNA polymerase sigma factor (sigma-70 family)
MTTPMNKVIQHLRNIARLQAAGERTDGQLLESFVSRRETAAIEALVRRHGPMVWGVCRRILRNHHDAEDAFQATFLVLVRKAATVMPREMVGNWLYGVAHQTALKARATRAKRQTRERQVADMPEPAVTEPGLWRDLQPVLDQELSRLPDKYRVAIVLCDLEGKTRKEAARQLGCPEGTVAGRLARARIMLAKRLTRRGVALSGGALAAVLSQQAASAGAPTSVVVSTIKAASLLAAGKAAATGAISVKVAALTEGVMKAMLFTKLKTVLAVVLILGFVATGATVLTSRTAAGQDDKPPVAEKPVATSAKQEPEKKQEEFAWGKEVTGLQLGLALVPADQIAYRAGQEIKLELTVRNVSSAAITISHGRLQEYAPKITDAQGKTVYVAMPFLWLFAAVPTKRILKPGETVTLYKPEVAVEGILEGKADPTTVVGTPTIRVRPGKYNIAFGGIVQSHPTLSTGAVEFEVTGKNSKAKDGAQTSLSDAIKALNTNASHNPVGKDETPTTEPEVVAAIRAAERPKDSAVTDKLFDAFKKIAETKQLPPGAEFEAVGGPWDPGASFVYDVWWVRLRMPKEANGTYSFVIRERFIRSRTLQEEMARLEPKPGEEKPVDGGRTQEYIKALKARIEKMKTK